MKRVFSNMDQVIHLWANQTQSDARCTNVFFNGTKIWSYGYHYLLGQIHTYKGVKVALINSNYYSNTTAKHQRSAWGAVAHLTRIYVSDPSDSSLIPGGLLEKQEALLDDAFDFFNRRKFWSGYTIKPSDRLFEQIKEFNNTCKILKFKHLMLDNDDDFIRLMQSHVDLMHEREKELTSPENLAKKEKARLKREELKTKKLENEIKTWKAVGTLTDGVRSLHPQIIRIQKDVVQTSRGAEVPLFHAKRLLTKFLNSAVKTGDKIGPFQVSEVRTETIVIGCHVLSIEDAKNELTKNN